MVALHTVYRCVLDSQVRWKGYLVGHDLAVEADTLPQARNLLPALFTAQVRPWPHEAVVEHTEQHLGGPLWVREALDAHVDLRGHVTRVLCTALAEPSLRDRLASLPESAAGGLPVAACVPGDGMNWIAEQCDGVGTLVVATAVTNHRLWWNALVPDAAPVSQRLPTAASLADLGLADRQATLVDWMAASATGRVITMPRHSYQHVDSLLSPRPYPAIPQPRRTVNHRGPGLSSPVHNRGNTGPTVASWRQQG